MNIISALGAYCFFDNKPKALPGYCIENTNQLSLFKTLAENIDLL